MENENQFYINSTQMKLSF